MSRPFVLNRPVVRAAVRPAVWTATGEPSQSVLALMIGNSYTKDFAGVPSLETIIDAIAAQDGRGDLTVTTRASDGYSLASHVADSATTTAINSQQWTHVVLQGLSNEAADASLRAGFRTNGDTLADRILANNPNTRIALFETPAYGVGHPSYPGTFADPATMMDETTEGYELLAADIVANTSATVVDIVKCGTLIELAGGNRATTDALYRQLHQADFTHQNNDRQVLEACQFYTYFTGRSAESYIVAALAAVGITTIAPAVDLADWAYQYQRFATSPPNLVPTIKIDFGDSVNTPSTTDTGWSNVTLATGSTNLNTEYGADSGANIVVSTFGNSWNNFGAASGAGFTPPIPNNASSDAWFGNDLSPTISFYVENLVVGTVYTARFYSSRAGISPDGRHTKFTLTGTASVNAEIESAGNSTNVLTLTGTVDTNGRLTVLAEKGPSNVNASGFFYLNALTLTPTT